MSLERREKYRLELTPRFDKELHKLPKQVMSRIAENIEELKVNPYSFKRLHGELEGLYLPQEKIHLWQVNSPLNLSKINYENQIQRKRTSCRGSYRRYPKRVCTLEKLSRRLYKPS